jgi:hypothetical protein
MNNETTYHAHSAVFRVLDAPEAHKEIERRTGIQPTHCHKAGDIRLKDKRWENTIWTLKSPLPESESLSVHLRWLWEALAPHQEYFRTLKESGVKMDLFCGFRSNVDTGGFSIEPDALKVATELGLTLEVSVIIV